jgi:hypothetical protein
MRRQREPADDPTADPMAWLRGVYQTVAGDDPDEDGVWLDQLDGWLGIVRQQLAQAKRRRERKADKAPTA